MDRRRFTQTLLASLVSYGFLRSAHVFGAFDRKIRPVTDHWAKRLNTYCLDLRKGAVQPAEWQSLVEELFSKVDLAELTNFIDLDRLIKGFEFPDKGVNTEKVTFPKLSGLPERTAFVKKIFGMRKDRAIIPHGHSNMCSAHLVLDGRMHLRHYDKIGAEADHLIIRPTIDKIVGPGDASSISDEKDNVHWFIAESESAFTFDVIMLDLDGKAYDIHNLDIYAQEKRGDGSLRVPLLDVQTALARYGKESHHD